MAIMRSSLEKEELRRLVKSSQAKAQRLLEHAEALSKVVFTSTEALASFLDLTARIHHYDAYNLLLIWERCPSASYLAGYKVWERQLPSGAQILKREHMGKGIEVIAPFTDKAFAEGRLVWHSVNIFDISQTMAQTPPHICDAAYVLDDAHEYFLLDALKLTIATTYDRSVFVQPLSQMANESGLPGEITDVSVTASPELSAQELIVWLTEAMCQLAVAESGLTPSANRLLRDCIRYCLLRIWGLDELARPPGSILQLKSVESDQMTFLHLLRDTVRDLNNLISGCYITKRQDFDEEDLGPDDLIFSADDSGDISASDEP